MPQYLYNSELSDFHRPILEYGPADWTSQIEEAETEVIHRIDIGWYRIQFPHWPSQPMVSERIQEPEKLKRPVAYKALSLAFLTLMKDADDRFGQLQARFQTLFEQEMTTLLAAGFDYDADGSETIEDEETARSNNQPMRLIRF